MASIFPLYSSSSGNTFLLENDNSNILIDVGVTFKAINEGLKSKNKTIDDVDAVIITHEHIDHIKALPLICRKRPNIPVYACGRTADYLKETLDEKNIPSNIRKVYYNEPFNIKSFNITPFEISHDAIMPCGYNIKINNKKIAYATDLGYVSEDVYLNLKQSDYIILESNYDSTLLDFGKYPYNLKRRIKSPTGHLSNEDCANTIARLAKDGTSNFILAHMSQNNNSIELAKNTLDSILNYNGIDTSLLNISYATKDLCDEVYKL